MLKVVLSSRWSTQTVRNPPRHRRRPLRRRQPAQQRRRIGPSHLDYEMIKTYVVFEKDKLIYQFDTPQDRESHGAPEALLARAERPRRPAHRHHSESGGGGGSRRGRRSLAPRRPLRRARADRRRPEGRARRQPLLPRQSGQAPVLLHERRTGNATGRHFSFQTLSDD